MSTILLFQYDTSKGLGFLVTALCDTLVGVIIVNDPLQERELNIQAYRFQSPGGLPYICRLVYLGYEDKSTQQKG
jgi:hypothetical protein